jgi:hypothetical protein
MITHIVIWKYRDDVLLETRAEHLEKLRGLASSIKEVESLSVGSDVLRLARSFDTGLVATFRDLDALDVYTNHPEHLKVVELGKSISEKVASVDFES